MDPHRPLTPRIFEYVHRVERVRVHGRHDPARIVGANGNQTQIKRSPQIADLLEGRAVRVDVVGVVVVDVFGEFRDGAVARVAAEPDFFAAAFDEPAGPERFALVQAGAGGGVLAGEAADAGGDDAVA